MLLLSLSTAQFRVSRVIGPWRTPNKTQKEEEESLYTQCDVVKEKNKRAAHVHKCVEPGVGGVILLKGNSLNRDLRLMVSSLSSITHSS